MKLKINFLNYKYAIKKYESASFLLFDTQFAISLVVIVAILKVPDFERPLFQCFRPSITIHASYEYLTSREVVANPLR